MLVLIEGRIRARITVKVLVLGSALGLELWVRARVTGEVTLCVSVIVTVRVGVVVLSWGVRANAALCAQGRLRNVGVHTTDIGEVRVSGQGQSRE